MRTIKLDLETIADRGHAFDAAHIVRHFNLTQLHGEREFIRQAFVRDVDGDGVPEILSRTLNGNRARAMRSDCGATLWVSEDVNGWPASVQISDMAVGDLDEDGRDEVILASYQGHYTWTFDIDDDGYHEVCVCGDQRIVWFDHDGTRLFDLPTPGEEGHPDDVRVCKWRADVPGPQIIYLDGTHGIVVSDNQGNILQRRSYPEEIASHLQLLHVLPGADNSVRLVASNIRSPDSKLLLLDEDLTPIWGVQIAPDLLCGHHMDWDGDGEMEIIAGAQGGDVHYRGGPKDSTVMVIKQDGTPIYTHEFSGYGNAGPLLVTDLDCDGRDEVLVSVGGHDGPEGRWSLPEGVDGHLVVLRGG